MAIFTFVLCLRMDDNDDGNGEYGLNYIAFFVISDVTTIR